MAEAVRRIDRLDLGFGQAEADELNARFAGVRTTEMLQQLLRSILPGQVSVVSSFGAESAVLLHLVGTIDPAIDVVFVDTLKHFPETLAYQEALIERIGLTGVRRVTPDAELLAVRDDKGLRWSYDPDGCCDIRKVQPLKAALDGVTAWISGRKSFQAVTRRAMPLFEIEDGRLKVNPLGSWSKADIDTYFRAHDLPRHPLESEGYPSIGCSPCTSKVLPGEDPRAGRWRGWDKVECGIHVEPADDPIF